MFSRASGVRSCRDFPTTPGISEPQPGPLFLKTSPIVPSVTYFVYPTVSGIGDAGSPPALGQSGLIASAEPRAAPRGQVFRRDTIREHL